MSNKILFVFEGERTEKQITDNLTRFFLNENTIIKCAFCSDIYQLHKQISEDEDLDTFILLKERKQNAENLSAYSRNDFAEIYMFFDYDGHSPQADDKKLQEVISFFSEETRSGKLFISYPMVEALKHYSDSIDFKKLRVKAKEKISYKKIVGEKCKNEFSNLTTFTRQIWVKLILLHLKKMNLIVHGDYSLPTESISQNDVFLNQLEKYINIDSSVAVLSSFPVFLFDYYGPKFIGVLDEDAK